MRKRSEVDKDLAWTTLETPIGDIVLIAGPRGLRELRLPPGGMATRTSSSSCAQAEAELIEPARQLREYFAGKRREFELRLDLVGTPFQLSVWRALLEIPFGVTMSYGGLARRVGRPAAARAVGAANGANPVAIVVPCHRVIGADGTLTGFGGGLPMKRALLALESGA